MGDINPDRCRSSTKRCWRPMATLPVGASSWGQEQLPPNMNKWSFGSHFWSHGWTLRTVELRKCFTPLYATLRYQLLHLWTGTSRKSPFRNLRPNCSGIWHAHLNLWNPTNWPRSIWPDWEHIQLWVSPWFSGHVCKPAAYTSRNAGWYVTCRCVMCAYYATGQANDMIIWSCNMCYWHFWEEALCWASKTYNLNPHFGSHAEHTATWFNCMAC